MYATYRTNLRAIRLVEAILAAAAIATVALGAAAEGSAARSPGTTSTPASTIGVATGETVNGVPIYRLPPITVTASRKVELAKIAQEDATARVKRDRAKVSAVAPPTRATLTSHTAQQ